MPWTVSPLLMIEDMRLQSWLLFDCPHARIPAAALAIERLSGRRDLLQTDMCVRECVRASVRACVGVASTTV